MLTHGLAQLSRIRVEEVAEDELERDARRIGRVLGYDHVAHDLGCLDASQEFRSSVAARERDAHAVPHVSLSTDGGLRRKAALRVANAAAAVTAVFAVEDPAPVLPIADTKDS